MSFDEILNVIKSLANSQGFYSRLYKNILDLEENDPYSFSNLKESMENKNFKDPVDVVLYFES